MCVCVCVCVCACTNSLMSASFVLCIIWCLVKRVRISHNNLLKHWYHKIKKYCDWVTSKSLDKNNRNNGMLYKYKHELAK